MAPKGGGGGKKGAGKKNPFETVGNKRKRPVVLNHRVKGAVRDVGRSRAKADERRKAGLLGELARERRENAFEAATKLCTPQGWPCHKNTAQLHRLFPVPPSLLMLSLPRVLCHPHRGRQHAVHN